MRQDIRDDPRDAKGQPVTGGEKLPEFTCIACNITKTGRRVEYTPDSGPKPDTPDAACWECVTTGRVTPSAFTRLRVKHGDGDALRGPSQSTVESVFPANINKAGSNDDIDAFTQRQSLLDLAHSFDTLDTLPADSITITIIKS